MVRMRARLAWPLSTMNVTSLPVSDENMSLWISISPRRGAQDRVVVGIAVDDVAGNDGAVLQFVGTFLRSRGLRHTDREQSAAVMRK